MALNIRDCVSLCCSDEKLKAISCLIQERRGSVVVSTSAWNAAIRGSILGPCMLY